MTAERFRENEFGLPEIPSAELTIEMVPAVDAPYPREIVGFALTFDGYAYYSNRVSSIANHAQDKFEASGKLPRTLDRLRACLFWQQRFWHSDGGMPDEDAMRFIKALLGAIRGIVERRRQE